MIIHVRDFGKIKSADIDFGQLVILIGENNTGKTYLMQLMYGLLSFFNDNIFRMFIRGYSKIKIKEKTVVKKDDYEFYRLFNEDINALLHQYKEKIVANTFHTDEISIGELSIDFNAMNDEYAVIYEGLTELNNKTRKRYAIQKNNELLYRLAFEDVTGNNDVTGIIRWELLSYVVSDIIGLQINTFSNRKDNTSFIYLPASRSGMMLLYANYLSDIIDKTDFSDSIIEIGSRNNRIKENSYGLTEPVYDFLQLLLTYKNSIEKTEHNKDIISFINDYIIEGSLEKIGNSLRYTPNKVSKSIPIYLSSSLATEIAPLYQILSGVNTCNTIFYDEIETCQHPTKQLQLARLLMRMVNAGYRMMVSTHSVTMAAAVNNLIILAFKNDKVRIASKLGYSEHDLLKTKSVKAYEFIIEDDKTTVKEISGDFLSGVGFDFDLFNTSNDKIYEDALTLAGGKT